MAEAIRTRLTAAEYALMAESNLPTELIDGEVIAMPAPKIPHQRASRKLLLLLQPLIPGGELFYAPTDVTLDEFNVVQPDLFWVSGPESLCKEGEDNTWRGAPDLVIEILSPGTSRRDRREKMRLYEQHGAREYWLFDPEGLYLEVWPLVEGKFRQQGIYGPGETFTSPVLGGAAVDLSQVFGEE